VYVRQSTSAQVEHNRESTQRQYQLVDRAVELGWQRNQVHVIDEDLGVSGGGLTERSGFAGMISEVAIGRIGIVLGLEASRLARNNTDWYRLLDLCSVTDTLIGDADGLYHPALFNDRLVLGLKGTMSEAELHVLKARLQGGIRNKAERGELRRSLPVGFVWGDADGEVLFHPDEAVVGALRCVFQRFAELGSARQVWLWFSTEKLLFPLRTNLHGGVRWAPPTYSRILEVLTNPFYAGIYTYGRTRQEGYVDESGKLRKRTRRLPREEWAVVLHDHHEGFIDRATYEANQIRLAANARPLEPGGAVREGAALLQGIAVCGRCGRKLRVYYSGRIPQPGYHCTGQSTVNGPGACMRIRGQAIDKAVASAFLATVAPAGLEAALRAIALIEGDNDAGLAQMRREVERLQYQAQHAERRYRAVDPENRLVARGLESDWETCLRQLNEAQGQLQLREAVRPRHLSTGDRATIIALGRDLDVVWSASSTTDRDRKELLRTLLEEVIITVDREAELAHLTLRWQGGLISDIEIPVPPARRVPHRTDEDTIEIVRRLAALYPDGVIAGVLNRQKRRTATGLPFTSDRVCSLRAHWKIPRFEPSCEPSSGELLSVRRAAEVLGVSPSTLHRCLNAGVIVGEQLTPGAPWRIRITPELRARFLTEPPDGYVPVAQAVLRLGVSRQTVLQRVKRGELDAVQIIKGRRKGLMIKLPEAEPSLFDS
jgi:DNA invertase Pin-like site-specific DNA recombinase